MLYSGHTVIMTRRKLRAGRMAQTTANGIAIEYETHGPANGAPILMIMGLGWQLTRWPAQVIANLIAAGHRVITFDNRDIGLSQKMDELGPPNLPEIMAARMAGRAATAPYALDDMARDAVGVLDALGIQRAHIVGASMGGMIGQLVAADHGARALSLTSIMSSSANPALPPPRPAAMALFATRPPDPKTDLEGFVARGIETARVLQSPAFPEPDETLRTRVIADYERCYHPPGFARQYAAIIAAPDRRPKLKKLNLPVVVLHGADDPLVPVEAGRDTAENAPGSEIQVVPGMGHDFPPQLDRVVSDAVLRAIQRSVAAQ